MHKIKNICMVMLVSFLLSTGMATATDPDGKGLPTWMIGADKDYNYHGHGDSKRNGTLDILDVEIGKVSCDRNSQIGMGESHSRLADERPDMEYVLINIPLPSCVGCGVEGCYDGRSCKFTPCYLDPEGEEQCAEWGDNSIDDVITIRVDGAKDVATTFNSYTPHMEEIYGISQESLDIAASHPSGSLRFLKRRK